MSHILIIDDDLTHRQILRLRLELAGHKVTEAQNDGDGFQLALTNVPDLIFLDIMMPKVDGWHVCRQIKTNPKTKSIPVVMFTALDQQIDKLRSFENGADAFLTKPCGHDQLLETLAKFLPASPRPVSP